MTSDTRRLSVAVAHPCLGAGGSEAAVLWVIQALRDQYDVSLVTGCPIELERLNGHCETSLVESDFSAVVAPQGLRRLIGHTDALRGAVFSRFLGAQASRYDVCIGGYNVMDFGKPGIHFIADFSFDDRLRWAYHSAPSGARSWGHRSGRIRQGYLGLVRAVAGRSRYNGAGDLIVANSEWTADLLRSRLGMVVDRVIYPPVVADIPRVPWERRDTGFVVLGRVHHAKRLERVIEILGRVRARGHDVHLHVIGGIGDDAYGRRIRGLVAANRGWCFAEGERTGADKRELLAQHRYGIHACEGEGFGISVAEQVKAGCLPFVPGEGGPAEIVGTDELTYASEDEAVAKILAVLADSMRQQDLRALLARRAGMFSTQRFMSEVRSLVAEWLARGR